MQVVSVFGPFSSRALVEMSVKDAEELFPDGLGSAGSSRVVDAVERDLATIRQVVPALADSALAATAISLAYEIEHPYNSATSKSMCAKALMDAMATLRELAPPKQERDDLDEISAARARRLAARSSTGAH
jgi:hypothetical protein